MSLLPPGIGGKPLELSLGVLDAIGEAGMVILPESPTPGMIGAAARAAGVDEATARKVYQAMVREAE
jgi:hypothetical protein